MRNKLVKQLLLALGLTPIFVSGLASANEWNAQWSFDNGMNGGGQNSWSSDYQGQFPETGTGSFDSNGIQGTSLSYDIMEVPSLNSLDTSAPFSLSLWFLRTDFGFDETLIAMHSEMTGQGFSVGFDDNDRLKMTLAASGGAVVAVTDESFMNGDSWVHLVVTYDGSQSANGVQMYINGQLAAKSIEQDNLSGSISESIPLTVGAKHVYDFSIFGGNIDEVQINNTIYSAADIACLNALQSDCAAPGDGGSEVGPQGFPGFKGPKGPQGLPGPKGVRGNQGEKGLKGLQGSQGAAGEQGDPGEKGERGEKGDRGARGRNGQDGVDGRDGRKGEPGVQGPDGERGPKGVTGNVGPKGLPGNQGQKGLRGAAGDVGLKGDKGDKGARGPDGDKGEQGPRGTQGPQGDRGDRGERGDKGDKGIPGTLKGYVGIKGERGDPGPRGPKGDRGSKGPKGEKGYDVTIYYSRFTCSQCKD